MFDGTELIVVIRFLMIAIPPILVFSYRFDTAVFVNTCCKLSLLNFLLLALIPFLPFFDYSSRYYMRFGYGMVVTVLFSYIAILNGKNKKDEKRSSIVLRKLLYILVFAFSLVESIVYGSRGVLLVILSFVAIVTLLIYKENRKRNFFLVVTGFAVVLNLESILNWLIDVSSKFGVKSYALSKYKYQLMYGLEEASSGRDSLYRTALETIHENPFFGAKMINYDDSLYVHNLFLQVGRDMGVLAMIISVFFVGYCIFVLWKKKIGNDDKIIIAVIFCVSVVRLLVSSNIWERPEFWILVCLILNYNAFFDAASVVDKKQYLQTDE